jgi:peptidyl-prolyl cis-trans isomerase A (cyclophilin A)
MNRRHLLAAAAAFLAAPLLAQSAPATMPAPAEDLVKVALDTEAGRIVLALDRGRAPLSTANILKYVDAGRYDGEPFFRAVKNDESGGFIQAGIRSDSRKLFPPVAHEPTSKTGLKHVAGAVSLARLEPGSARADFFILTTDIPGFDAGGYGGDADGFAVFGKVVEGMDVVAKIYASPVSPTKGEGAMKGQLLDPVVKIVKASRVQPPKS